MIVIIINFIFCPNIIYFCSVKLDFSISYKESASKSLQSTEISLYLAFTNELNVAQKEKMLMNDWFFLKILFCWWKSKLVNSYTLKHDVNRCFWNPAWSKCKHVYKPVGSFINNRVCQYVNTTDLIVIEHYIAI